MLSEWVNPWISENWKWINNWINNWINFELNSVKGIVDNLLIDKEDFFNKKISDFLIKNKSKFTKKMNLEWSKNDLLHEWMIDINFSWCDIFNSVDFNDWLIKLVVSNIIKDVYWLRDSNFHEVHFWKNENTFCVFHYKNEVKRYNSFSEDTMKSVYEKFTKDIDFVSLIDSKINEKFDFDKYSENELKDFYEWWYKSKIIEIIKDEFYDFLPSLVFDNLENEVIVWMVQFFYRKNFDDINDLWLRKFNWIITDNISDDINDWSKEKKLLVENVIKKFIRFNSNEIIELSWLNFELSSHIFENEIKPIINFINDHPNFSKDKASHEFENNWLYIKSLILKYNFFEWEKIIKKYWENELGINIDSWLIKSILSNNVLSKWISSLSFELSKLIFKYLVESSVDYTWTKIKKWFEVFFDNFNWELDKNWIKKQFFKPVVLKKWWIDIQWWFWKNFIWEFDNLLSRENLALHNFNLKNEKDVLHHVDLINETLKWFNLRSVKLNHCVSEWKFIVFHLIKEFWNILVTKK